MTAIKGLDIETVKRINKSPHRLQFTLNYGTIPVVFDVPPGGEVDVPKIWCEKRPSAGREPMPSVLSLMAPHLVEPDADAYKPRVIPGTPPEEPAPAPAAPAEDGKKRK